MGETIKPNYLVILNLNLFKINICNISSKHNLNICNFYHDKKDKRRDLNIYKYRGVLCKNQFSCTKGEYCEFSHNMIEFLYHPDNFKKKFCFNYFSKGVCKFKKICSFAHSENELNIKLIHKLKQNYIFFLFFYKTEFCPWGIIKHDMNLCVYSHNFQDYKRKYLFKKLPIICKYWDIKKNYNNYSEGCKNGIDCKYLHGWKELSYHPIYYKKKKCKPNNKNCWNKLVCKNIHGVEKKYRNKQYLMPKDYPIY